MRRNTYAWKDMEFITLWTFVIRASESWVAEMKGMARSPKITERMGSRRILSDVLDERQSLCRVSTIRGAALRSRAFELGGKWYWSLPMVLSCRVMVDRLCATESYITSSLCQIAVGYNSCPSRCMLARRQTRK